MNVAQDQGSVHQSPVNVESLLHRYTVLLNLYSELETVSCALLAAIESGVSPQSIRESLAAKMAVADSIVRESRAIADLKRSLLEGGSFTSGSRNRVRSREADLTRAVGRIMEQENRERDLVMQRGVKIARR
jgi:hypothetical protein